MLCYGTRPVCWLLSLVTLVFYSIIYFLCTIYQNESLKLRYLEKLRKMNSMEKMFSIKLVTFVVFCVPPEIRNICRIVHDVLFSITYG